MKRVIFLFLVLAICFPSCQKETDNPSVEQEKVTDYFPLNVGNYWIYKTSTCDSLEFGCEEYRIDSVYISKREIYDGEAFYKIEGLLHNQIMLVRDSNEFLIDSLGKVIFALNTRQ